MSWGLYRQAALRKLSSPEQLDQLMRVTRPRGWLSLAAFGALVVAALVWSIAGTVQVTVPGQGVIVPEGGVFRIATAEAGVVQSVAAEIGGTVEQGQPLLTLKLQNGKIQPVSSPNSGRVLELLTSPGQVLVTGAGVVTVEPEGVPLEAVLYLPLEQGKQVRPGMTVELSPSTVNRETYGYMLAEVAAVSSYPASYAGAMAIFGNEQVVQSLLSKGPVIAVHASLLTDAATTSGYRWSSGEGPPAAISSGTFASGSIRIAEQRPISLLLPFLNEPGSDGGD